MATIILTPSATTTTATVLADLAAGTAQLHKERSNGTTRRVHYLAPGSQPREVAEFIEAMRDNEWTMRKIATELAMSVAATRRSLTDLIITREFEEADEEELAALLEGAEEAEAASTEPSASAEDAGSAAELRRLAAIFE
jgi:hypothetical protein